MVNNGVEEERSDVTVKCHEAGEIDANILEKKMVEQTKEYKCKIALGENIYKILGKGNAEEGALATDLKDALDFT